MKFEQISSDNDAKDLDEPTEPVADSPKRGGARRVLPPADVLQKQRSMEGDFDSPQEDSESDGENLKDQLRALDEEIKSLEGGMLGNALFDEKAKEAIERLQELKLKREDIKRIIDSRLAININRPDDPFEPPPKLRY